MEKIGENQIIIQYLSYLTCWEYAVSVDGLEHFGNIQVLK